jgi:hypothetical protein
MAEDLHIAVDLVARSEEELVRAELEKLIEPSRASPA